MSLSDDERAAVDRTMSDTGPAYRPCTNPRGISEAEQMELERLSELAVIVQDAVTHYLFPQIVNRELNEDERRDLALGMSVVGPVALQRVLAMREARATVDLLASRQLPALLAGRQLVSNSETWGWKTSTGARPPSGGETE